MKIRKMFQIGIALIALLSIIIFPGVVYADCESFDPGSAICTLEDLPDGWSLTNNETNDPSENLSVIYYCNTNETYTFTDTCFAYNGSSYNTSLYIL